MAHSILIADILPDGTLERWRNEFAECEFLDGRETAQLEEHLPQATISYGRIRRKYLNDAPNVRWLQLTSAGVPRHLCVHARAHDITLTNLAGMYGPTIAEHTIAMTMMLARNLHVAHRNQAQKKWDESVRDTMLDLHGRTLAIIGLGDIGRHVARLAHGMGMRVVGTRRRPQPTPYVDCVYQTEDLIACVREADFVVVAAPLTNATEGILGPQEFAAMKPGVIYVNVSRGAIAKEGALIEALNSGHVRAAGLDVFAEEPLPKDHVFWSMPQVLVSPHYAGETVNYGPLPSERFARNLRHWLNGSEKEMEGRVDKDAGY